MNTGTAGPGAWFRDLTADGKRAHMAVASLSSELTSVGWAGPVAAAVVPTDSGPRVAVVTADGLSCLPPGVKLPAGAFPLSDLAPLHAVRDRLGDMDVRGKLVAAAEAAGLDIIGPIVATGELADPAHRTQTPDMVRDLRRLGVVPPATVVPGADAALPSLLSGQTPAPGRTEWLGGQLRGLRWEGPAGQPESYTGILTSWLIATATAQGSAGGWWAYQAASLWKSTPEKEKIA